MSRQTCIQALVNTLGTASDFLPAASGTVVAYDNRAAASGVDRAVIVRHLRGEKQPRYFSWDWYLAADIWIRTNNKLEEARGTASILVQAAIDTIKGNANLGGAVTEAEAIENRLVSESMRFARGVFYVEEITVRVREPA